jgi:Tol biopolymer transport system component
VALAALAGLVAGAAAMWQRTPATPPVRPLSFSIETDVSRPVRLGPQESPIALAPDGTFVVFTAPSENPGGTGALLIDRFDSSPPTALVPAAPGLDPRSPFVSPDGQWVGFFSNGDILKAPSAGGNPVAICSCHASSSGGAWMPDGSIVFRAADALRIVAADGGARRDLTRVNREAGERTHLNPSVGPDGRSVIFTVVRSQVDDATVEVVDIATGRRSVIRAGVFGKYVPPGILVTLDAAGVVHGVRVDAETLRPMGPDIVLPVGTAQYSAEGGAAFDAALNGTLALTPADTESPRRALAWVSRDGTEERLDLPLRGYTYPRISPRGDIVALDIREDEFNISLWNPQHGSLDALTIGNRNGYPAWTSDGRALLFSSDRDGIDAVFRVALDRPGEVATFIQTARPLLPYAVSPDGAFTVLREVRDGRTRLLVAPVTTPDAMHPLTAFGHAIVNAEISRDGRWLAFQSDESGRPEIYVQPFPDPGQEKMRVSTGGGLMPLWAGSGNELLYMDPSHELQVATFAPTPEGPRIGTRARFFPAAYSSRHWYQEPVGRTFDLMPDGSRFLVVLDPERSGRRSGKLRVVVGAADVPEPGIRDRIMSMIQPPDGVSN